MSRTLIVHKAGPGMTVQDLGRSGYLAFGFSRGGAVDRLALAEGAALLRQSQGAVIEMAGSGGAFEATEDMRIALTGAPMRADIDGDRISWNASHLLAKGTRLTIGAVEAGNYGYLTVGGNLQIPVVLDAQSTHLTAGIGEALKPGDRLAVGPDERTETGMTLTTDDRFHGGTIHLVPSLQTESFDPDEITRFETTRFHRDLRANRMGMRILSDGEGFHAESGLTILSEVIVPGDVQITGDGTPFVLLSECQTTGGYPRIGTVLPGDLPRVAQTPPGAELSFRFVSLKDGADMTRRHAARLKTLGNDIRPLVRSVHSMTDLLSYQLISGVTAGDDLERE